MEERKYEFDIDYDYVKDDIKPVNNYIPEILEYIEDNAMEFDDLDVEIECLIDNFIMKNALHMIYAKAGTGKTYMAIGLSLRLLKEKKVDKVIYIDQDNSVPALKSRGLQQVVQKYEDFKLITRGKGDMNPNKLLHSLADACRKDEGIYKDYLFIFDSIRDFMGGKDMNSDKDVMMVMDALKDIRDHGQSTIVFLHHTNRAGEGEAYKGSSSFINSVDEGFSLKGRRTENGLEFELQANKKRLPLTEVAFDLDTTGSEMILTDQNFQKKQMRTKEIEVVEETQQILEEYKDGLSQSELLEKMGKSPKDHTGIKYLQKYINKYWKTRRVPEKSNMLLYLPMDEEDKQVYES